MNNDLKALTDKYKPLKYTIKGKTINLFSTTGDYVIKPTNKNINELFKYLSSRNFSNFPKIVEQNDKYVTYEYVNSLDTPKEQQLLDMILVVSKLHNKTAYFKEVTEDKYTEIYDNIKSNILFLKDYYSKKYDEAFNEIYSSPSNYYFLLNYSLINNDLVFIENELDEWFNLVKEQNRQRVCLVHNNLSLDHYLRSDKPYLVSWDNSRIDMPIYDLVNLYHNHYLDFDFSSIFKQYLSKYPLTEEETILFHTLISIPNKIEYSVSEYKTVINIRKLLDYIYKTSNLLKEYSVEKQTDK